MKHFYTALCTGLLLLCVTPLWGQHSKTEALKISPEVMALKQAMGLKQVARMDAARDRMADLQKATSGEGGCVPYMGRSEYLKMRGREEIAQGKVGEGQGGQLANQERP